MEKEEFIIILEAALRSADSNISLVDFDNGNINTISIWYKDDTVYSVNVADKSLLEILHDVTDLCIKVQDDIS